jgi:hypothetical protein
MTQPAAHATAGLAEARLFRVEKSRHPGNFIEGLLCSPLGDAGAGAFTEVPLG